MKNMYLDFLFSKGIFVAQEQQEAHVAEVLVSLGKLFNIQIVSGAELACMDMISVAERNLGRDVPLPFYRGFPQSVLELFPEELLLDQLVHYIRANVLGELSESGHSIFEQAEFERSCFNESAAIRPFRILTEDEAEEVLRTAVDDLLTATRPLSQDRYELVRSYLADYSYRVTACGCKDTVVRLLLDTRDAALAELLSLSQVIRLVEQMQYQNYDSEDIRKLDLRNQDRKFLTAVLDRIFEKGTCDVRACFEKQKLWCGLLHHIHYKPKNKAAKTFVAAMRESKNRSAYATFEAQMAAGDVRGAVETLIRCKGSAAVLRNLQYLLSRCRTEEDCQFVLEHMGSKNKTVLLQLLMKYGSDRDEAARTFRFVKFNTMRKHQETAEEAARRRSCIPEELRQTVARQLRRNLVEVCRGTLGKVYVDESMKRIALPLQESASMGGVGVLPKGSRIPIEEGKKIRGFTYWEQVNDIDLSVIGLTEEGAQREFSWRTMYANQSEAITFSGDVVNGYHGGSEYFDVNLSVFREMYPDVRYLVFCDNVFSGSPFSNCFCKAGYMVRDEEDSGEIFEPKTVASSFRITCDSTFAYLFAIDVYKREFVWLNVARDGYARVAGSSGLAFLLDYMDVTDVVNLYDFAVWHAAELAERPEDADVVFSDRALALPEGVEQIRSCDFEKVMALMSK